MFMWTGVIIFVKEYYDECGNDFDFQWNEEQGWLGKR